MANSYAVQYVDFYTQGSTARKIVPAIRTAKAVLPKPRKRRKAVIWVDPVALVGILVAVCMMITMTVGLIRLQQAQSQMQAMERYVQTLSARNQALSQEYAAGYDLAEIERTALALGMVPQSQVPQTVITVEVPQQAQSLSVWHSVGTFLSSLFA